MSNDRVGLTRPVIGHCRTLASVALPIAVIGFLQTGYQLIDAYWLSSVGRNHFAAATVGMPIIALVSAVGWGLNVVSAVRVARAAGMGDIRAIGSNVANSILASTLLSIAVVSLCFLQLNQIIVFMGTPSDIVPVVRQFVGLLICGLPLVYITGVCIACLQGVGNNQTPLRIALASIAINGALAPLFILGLGGFPRLELLGAAVATLVSQLVAVMLSLWSVLFRETRIAVQAEDWLPSRHILMLLRQALPVSFEQLIGTLNILAMTGIVAGFGSVALLAYGSGIRLFIFASVISGGIRSALSILISRYIGEGDWTRARQVTIVGIWSAFAIMMSLGTAVFTAAPAIAQVFTGGREPDHGALTEYLKITSFNYGASGVVYGVAGALRGRGLTKLSLSISLVQSWIFLIPLAVVLPSVAGWGVRGLWLAPTLASVAASCIGLHVLRGKMYKAV